MLKSVNVSKHCSGVSKTCADGEWENERREEREGEDGGKREKERELEREREREILHFC